MATGMEPVSVQNLKAAIDAVLEAQASLKSTFISCTAYVPNMGESDPPYLNVSGSGGGVSATIEKVSSGVSSIADVTFKVTDAGTYDLSVAGSFSSRHQLSAGETFSHRLVNVELRNGFKAFSLFVERVA